MHSATLPPDLRTIAREATRSGSTFAPQRTASIIGLGHWSPAEVVPNSALAGRLGVDDAWIVKRTGVHTRRRAAPTERLSDMATWAARRALSDPITMVEASTTTPTGRAICSKDGSMCPAETWYPP